MIKFSWGNLLVFLPLLIFAACSYKLGYPDAGEGLFHLRVKNDSMAPIIGAKVDRELRKKILKNGTFILVQNQEDADVSILVTLSNYTDSTEAYRPEDSLLAAGLNLGISAKIELRDQHGDIFLDKQVRANASVLRSESTRLPEESSSLHAIAEDLASEIHLSILNQSW
ncbi:MAG: LPS assembly lipoprotein LptE [Opitutales bacterium]|nr:LPS assembly lipoprotein LptE [Opitutales bacterium]MDG1355453.1 LPS assembly lipoprotein LptE [Opitutales bacterium]